MIVQEGYISNIWGGDVRCESVCCVNIIQPVLMSFMYLCYIYVIIVIKLFSSLVTFVPYLKVAVQMNAEIH